MFKHTCKVIMHFSLSQTLAVVSQDPLKSVPNFPEDRVQTMEIKHKKAKMLVDILAQNSRAN